VRITVACPENMISDANHLAMVLAFSPADANTYGEPLWEDAQGARYAAASFEVAPEWIGMAQTELLRPDWDAEEVIDMSAAVRAQAALLFTTGPVPAAPFRLTAIGGMDGLKAMDAMGLKFRVEA
jgi:hypothetical protein